MFCSHGAADGTGRTAKERVENGPSHHRNLRNFSTLPEDPNCWWNRAKCVREWGMFLKLIQDVYGPIRTRWLLEIF